MSLPDYAQSTFWIVVITVVLIILVALLTLWERKVIGWMQLRRGPNRVRIFGLLPGVGQPFADVFKLLLKEVIIPAKSNKLLFRLAPIIALIPAFAAWAVIPLSPTVVVSKADAGLLYLLSLTSMGVYGVIIAGWAANSKYAFLGGWRAPLEGYPGMASAPWWLAWLGAPGFGWLFLKGFVLVFLFLWFRATFPRYRYDQIMRLGWKALIPVTLVWIGVEMIMVVYRIGPWARPWYH